MIRNLIMFFKEFQKNGIFIKHIKNFWINKIEAFYSFDLLITYNKAIDINFIA